MTRIKAAIQADKRKALMSVCALAVAGAVIFASGANFTSSTANPGNTYTAGNLQHTNSKNGSDIFTASALKPGESRSGTVDITNTGDIDGVFTLSKAVTAETAGFATKLQLGVTDCKADGCGNANDTSVYSGSVSGMGSRALGTSPRRSSTPTSSRSPSPTVGRTARTTPSRALPRRSATTGSRSTTSRPGGEP